MTWKKKIVLGIDLIVLKLLKMVTGIPTVMCGENGGIIIFTIIPMCVSSCEKRKPSSCLRGTLILWVDIKKNMPLGSCRMTPLLPIIPIFTVWRVFSGVFFSRI
jgi:hypothetical protein